MRKLYFLLAILLIFSAATKFAIAEENLPPVVFGTDPYNYDYGKLRGDDPYNKPTDTFAKPMPALENKPQQNVGQLPPEQAKKEEFNLNAEHKFALLVPLSGKGADVGRALKDAALLALQEKGSDKYAVIPIDVNEKGAAAAAEKAVSYNVEVILGPVFSDDVSKVAKIARKNKIKIFSFSNNKMVAGGGIYVFGLIPSQQVERMLLYASNKGIKNYSAIVPNNNYGHSVSEMVTKFANWIGGSLKDIGLYSAKTSTSTAAKVIADAYKNTGTKPSLVRDGIVIAEGGERLKSVISAISSAGIGCGRVRCLGVSSWDDKDVVSSPALNGAWFAASPYEDVEDFLAKFQKKYNYLPDEISALGYDITAFAIEVSPNFNNATIEKKAGYKGLKGIYRFTPEGINQRGYAIYEINNGIAQVIDTSPNRF